MKLLCVIIFIVIAIVAYRVNRRDLNDDDEPEQKQEQDSTPADTTELMMNALREIGCQPQLSSDGTLAVQYQGENFHMEFGGYYVRVWDPMWAGISADDPKIGQVREAVNIANYNFGPTVVLTAPDEKGVIGFHSRRDILLHPQIPQKDEYVRAVLDSFFKTKENIRSQYQQLVESQAQTQSPRRPVGFATSHLSTDSAQSPADGQR